LNVALASRSSQIDTANQAEIATTSPKQPAARIGQNWPIGCHFLLM
jgi:hypothetical protein